MSSKFPNEIRAAIKEGAKLFGDSLELLEYPNSGASGPANEANVTLSVCIQLAKSTGGYFFYAEAAAGPKDPEGSKGRLDMIGYSKATNTALALEAKNFGKINEQSNSALRDLERMKTFKPQCTALRDDRTSSDWWGKADTRWGIIVIASFRGVDVKNAWTADDESTFRSHMGKYTAEKKDQPTKDPLSGEATGFLALYRKLKEEPGATLGAELITDGKLWKEKDCGEAWLLWCAIPIPATGSTCERTPTNLLNDGDASTVPFAR